jgi:hypothetical protein
LDPLWIMNPGKKNSLRSGCVFVQLTILPLQARSSTLRLPPEM